MRSALICPDSFKGTFSAPEVCEAIASGVRAAGMSAVEMPVADGGEGTLAVLLRDGGTRLEAQVRGPLGEPVEASFGLLAGGRVAVVEMAQASGLELVPPESRDAWRASTEGTGELIAAAAAQGPERVLVSVGGSATTDGGRGAVEALRMAGPLPPLTVLCDVETRFEDAARVFGPQKGADEAMVARLSRRLEEFAATLPRDPRGTPRTGCAGGLSGGLWAQFGAELVSGADFVLEVCGFDRALEASDLVVTGEGCLDSQSYAGKIVSAITSRSAAAGVPCCAVVGRSALSEGEAAGLGLERVLEATDASAQRQAGFELASEYS
ncbi:MAG: glycerate kinase [Solirubrobacterales bacterium]